MSRVVAPPPTDPSMWRKLLAVAHPDRGGDHSLFIWCQSLREYLEQGPRPRRESPPPGPERVPFDPGLGFDDLTRRARLVAGDEPEPFRSLLGLLYDCHETDHGRGYPAQYKGATYKQLAPIAHLARAGPGRAGVLVRGGGETEHALERRGLARRGQGVGLDTAEGAERPARGSRDDL